MVKVGDEIEVKVLRVDAKDRKIGLSMRNVDDTTVPDDVPDMPIEGPEAEKAMEESLKARSEKEAGKEKKEAAPKEKDAGPPKVKEKEPEKEGLRGGTGAGGPLFQLPGDKKE